ncbi:SMI1/KNR4 family protein [Actinokineospora diospyrosa]|uniref:SMI1 / KNR4 family (SUKH-1) n=1 Tax=Actinokineospora diospyrosa TaxID=103728 RepID=A0ABT1INA8_9PSEU|nr:SMI1/KNR4 family protein [Actinokineospora diospyrosa]MCP2274154.1 SMI1 / KNR4 family (SUKH-1) [Actinokineospora diospyrosa]
MYWSLRRRLVEIANRLGVLCEQDRPQLGKSVFIGRDGRRLDDYVTFGATHHKFQRQPVKQPRLRQLEKAMGVRLPEEFRVFLAWLGTGAGPYYGIASFEKLLQAAGPACARPFPWGENDTFWLNECSDADPDGCLPIINAGCGDYIALITAGAHRGRVVHIGWDFECVPGPDFLTYYDLWIIESLAKVNSGGHVVGGPAMPKRRWSVD